MDPLLIVAFGLLANAFVLWYFFGQKETSTAVTGSTIAISVDAGYSPSTIVVNKGKPVTLKVHRIDPSDCLDQLIIPQFHVVKALPLNKEIEITFTPNEVGKFPFHCGMNMFHGRIIVSG